MSSATSSRFTTVAHALAPSAIIHSSPLTQRLGDLYAVAQRSQHVFGSPLGPFYDQARHYHVPRFVYFGPHTSDESLRLALYAGFDGTDLRGTLSLLHFVERLALTPDLGQGLNLSFFPIVDILGEARGVARSLAAESWNHSPAPELALLAKDARLRGYHGFIRLESAPGNDDVVTLLMRGDPIKALGTEMISSEDVQPFDVRWEARPADEVPADGPLSILDDLPFSAFELTLRLPSAWSDDLQREAAITILKSFVIRYRGLQAYGQHL